MSDKLSILRVLRQIADPMGLPVSLTAQETLIQIRRMARKAIEADMKAAPNIVDYDDYDDEACILPRRPRCLTHAAISVAERGE